MISVAKGEDKALFALYSVHYVAPQVFGGFEETREQTHLATQRLERFLKRPLA